jgi:hypothetical protein
MCRFRHQKIVTSSNYLINVIVTSIHLPLIASSNYFPLSLLGERHLMAVRFRVVKDVTLCLLRDRNRKSLLR